MMTLVQTNFHHHRTLHSTNGLWYNNTLTARLRVERRIFMAIIDTGKIRQSAQTLMAKVGEMGNSARALPLIVEEAARSGGPQMQQFVEQVRNAALTAGAQQDTIQQVAIQMMAYADRVDGGG
jgi:hypothetical protein